jgi:anti-anti-sigma factor
MVLTGWAQVVFGCGPGATMGSEAFSITVEHTEQVTIVHVVGELDLSTAPELDAVLMELLVGPVTVDLSGLTFMDSSGIALFARALKRAATLGTSLTVTGVHRMQRRVFDIAGLTEQLHIIEDN